MAPFSPTPGTGPSRTAAARPQESGSSVLPTPRAQGVSRPRRRDGASAQHRGMDPREHLPRHPDRSRTDRSLPDRSLPDRTASSHGGRPSPGSPVQVVVRSPGDLLACAALALGFVPARSVVVLSLPPGRGPHARVDLVERLGDVPAMAQALVRPAVRHDVQRVAVVVMGELPHAARVAPGLQQAFEQAGIEVVALVGADGAHWLSLLRGQTTTVPREYDVLAHPFVADAVLRGQVMLSSRDAVRATVEPDPELVRSVTAAVRRRTRRKDAAWVRRTLERRVRTGSSPSATEVAHLVVALDDPSCRDAAWAWAERADARDHVDVWLRVVRGCPPDRVGPAAAVLAFHAWLAGDGALAWCALDRAAAGPRVTLAALVEDLLESAASPALWSPQLAGETVSPGGTSAGTGAGADVVDLAQVRRSGAVRAVVRRVPPEQA